WKGDFHVQGLGAGNARVGRMNVALADGFSSNPDYRSTPQMGFLFDCNLVDKSRLEGLSSAALVIGPRGFPLDQSAGPPNTPTQVELPLELVTQDAFMSYDRVGGPHQIPEHKYLGIAADAADLVKLAGNSGGLSYYARLTFNDGSTVWINKDGKAAQNF